MEIRFIHDIDLGPKLPPDKIAERLKELPEPQVQALGQFLREAHAQALEDGRDVPKDVDPADFRAMRAGVEAALHGVFFGLMDAVSKPLL